MLKHDFICKNRNKSQGIYIIHRFHIYLLYHLRGCTCLMVCSMTHQIERVEEKEKQKTFYLFLVSLKQEQKQGQGGKRETHETPFWLNRNRNITVWLTQDVQISEYVTRAKKHAVFETPAIKTLVMNYSKFIEYKVKMYNICNPFTILKFQSKQEPCFIRSLHQCFFTMCLV